MMTKLRKDPLILLALIVLTAAFLRFYQLGVNPPALNWDEAAWGYNAYSLGIDGKDEFGRFLPYTYLESFGDFKPPVYAYLSVLPIKIFGLSEFSIRFSSAFFGTLTVLMSYFLVLRIFPDSKQKSWYSLVTAGILALSPWHINLSRAAFEANVSTFFIVCGVWAFLAGVQEKKYLLLVSAASFVLSMHTFNTARIVSPLLVLLLAIVFHKVLLNRIVPIALAGLLGLCLILPTVPFLLSPQAGLRFREVNIFSDITVIQRINQEVINDHNNKFSKVIHHRYLTYAVDFLEHYFDNFSPQFLFITGDPNPKFSTQDVGQMYLWDLPFFLLGILYIFRKREKGWWLVLCWLLIGVIPAATARETPHALRIETTLPMFQLLTAIGVVAGLEWLQVQRRIKPYFTAVGGVIFLLLVLNVSYYLHGYYLHYPTERSDQWQYGYKDSVAYVSAVSRQYDLIYISDVIGRPYIYYLLYQNVAPSYFRKTADITRDQFGFVHVNGFGKYRFFDTTPISFPSGKRILVVNASDAVPKGTTIKKEFSLLNGMPILSAYTVE